MFLKRVALAAALGLALVASLPSVAPAASKHPSKHPHKVKIGSKSGVGPHAVIRRTAYGIPHVRADDFQGLGYGLSYAFAQDNVCELADLMVTVSGDRSRYFGADKDSGDPNAYVPATNLDNDVYYRWLNQSGVVERLIAKPAPLGPTTNLRALVAGYVAGYNEYLRRTGIANLSDPRCRGKAWVRPMTTIDAWRMLYDANQIAGLTSFKHSIATASPAAIASSDSGSLRSLAPRIRALGRGSNGVALGGAGTGSGNGMLLANPHFPWLGSGRTYQAQLTIPGVINVAGANFYGTPVIEIGHTDHLAWTHTISPAQRFTYFELQLVPGAPTRYVVNGQVESMTPHAIAVPTETGTATRTVYTSRYGPVVADAWSPWSALALAGASANNLRSFNEWLEMGQAQSVQQLRAVQSRYQGLPFVYTIAADTAGKAYLSDASVVPNVTDALAQRCVVTELGRALYPSVTVLDGSTTACAWGRDADAIEPGIFGPQAKPTIERTDWVANSNDSAWLSNPAQPLSYPRIFGDTGTERRLRTRLGVKMIQEGLPGGFTSAELRSLIMSDRNLSAEIGRDALVAMCRANPVLAATDGRAVNVTTACNALAAWDLRAHPESRGEILWRGFWVKAMLSPSVFTVPFDPARPLTTPTALNTGDSAVRTAFADAVQELQAWGIAVDAPLSAMQYTAVGGARTPVPGCTEQEGCYNIVCVTIGCNYGPGPDGVFGQVDYGSSFLMAIDLRPDGPQSQTLLTYSQSTDPTSPHHNDQTVLFSQRRWVVERYTDQEILSDPELAVTVLGVPGS